MNSRFKIRIVALAALLTCGSVVQFSAAQTAETAKPAEAVKPAEPAKTAPPTKPAKPAPELDPNYNKVLGDAAAWKFNPKTAALVETPAGPAIAPAAKGSVILESTADIQGPAEFVMQMYGTPATTGTTINAAASFQVYTQPKTETEPARGISISLNANGPSNMITYSVGFIGYKEIKATSGQIYLDAVSDRSLAWSEEMRATIEAQAAQAQQVDKTLITGRVVVEDGFVELWVNGRYVVRKELPADMIQAGGIRVQLSPITQLVSFRSVKAAARDGRFEPLSIAGHTNSISLLGSKVTPESLPGSPAINTPTAIKQATINQVPFEFPATDERGFDHIDVGQSWNRFGALPGYFKSTHGLFGGRWSAAKRVDPARINLYIPKGRYKALHLVAVAENQPDTIPLVSAQFYRPDAGHPINFSSSVPSTQTPANGQAGSKPVPVKLENGKSANLYHITIPLDPDGFSWLNDLDLIGLEITKQVHYYRGYPDPLEYSYHAGGLPSSVQIYAMTLEHADVDVEITPDVFGHVWTAPAVPNYTVTLRNDTGKPVTTKVTITAKSSDGKDESTEVKTVNLPAGKETVDIKLALAPKRYGFYDLNVQTDTAGVKVDHKRNFAHLHPDTREKEVWEDGHGPIFGFWSWGGGHDTPSGEREIPFMAAAGAETSTRNYEKSPPEIRDQAVKYRFISDAAFEGHMMYLTGFVFATDKHPKWDPADPVQSGKNVVEALKKIEMKPSEISRPIYVAFFAEPQIGNITTGIWPSHYGEEYTLTEGEQKTYDTMMAKYKASAGAIRKEWPNLKLLVPYGDPMNTLVFLKHDKEVASLIDGAALDLPGFERLPEQQVNQVVLNRMYPILSDIKKYKPDAYFVLVEGTHVSSKDIDTNQIGQANISIRNYLNLMGYGITRFESGNSPFDCANYWGENHYGGGWGTRIPLAMPKLGYVHFAAMTRNLNRANFVKYVPTGSTSTYAQQYKHYKTGNLVHTLWTVRGSRPVSIKVPAGTTLDLYDPQDNLTKLTEKNGVVTFTLGQSPVYLHGLKTDPVITLGEPDHSDSKPGQLSTKLTNLGDGTWKQIVEDDQDYRKNKPLQIERFQGKMDVKPTAAPKPQGSTALAIKLLEQEKDRGVMPFYTTLQPNSPLTIPGKASHLGMWVKASSDWGRVVYSLRDAKGEKWISVGEAVNWNNDDIHGWSNFCFDGWRYLTFQMPASAPWDSFREYGTSWWGATKGDGIVDLPLTLEKVIVERRPKAIVGNDLVPVSSDEVLLADLNIEYASAFDKSPEVVRQSKIRMPIPDAAKTATVSNPITEIAAKATLPATKVIKTEDPEFQFDGTRCHVHFEPVADAKSYDVWVSPYPDGRAALLLGKAWAKSGLVIRGLKPEREFFIFVTYTDKDGNIGKPSEPFKFKLQDRFGYK